LFDLQTLGRESEPQSRLSIDGIEALNDDPFKDNMACLERIDTVRKEFPLRQDFIGEVTSLWQTRRKST
jgi:hypothetical protein